MKHTKEAQAKLAHRSQLWVNARLAIQVYLLEYGVAPIRAEGAAEDLMNDEINDLIDEEGEF